MQYLQEIKRWLSEITEIFLLLVGLGIVVEILFPKVAFFGSVVTRLTALIQTLGDNGLVGLIALGVIIYLFQKRTVWQQQHHHQG